MIFYEYLDPERTRFAIDNLAYLGRPNTERITRWTLRDDGEDESGQGLREVEQDTVEVIAGREGELRCVGYR